MARGRKRSEATYRRLLTQHAESDLSLREFARRSGVSYWTLLRWRKLLEDADEEAPALVPVHVVRSSPAPPAQASTGAVLELHRSGHRVLLPASLSPEDLARIVAALEQPAC